MSRHPALLAGLLLAAVSCQRPPNVVWITVDALRADRLGCYGYERPTSPFLDRLASEGVRAESAISQAPSTKASVASMMTSLYPSSHRTSWHGGTDGAEGDVLPDVLRTLPERLRDAGYRTAAFVANPHLREEFGFDQGFSTHRYMSWGRASALMGDAADWIVASSSEPGPRFAYIHLMDVHHPYDPPQPYRGQFLNPKWSAGRPLKYNDGPPPEGFTAQDLRYLRDLYDGAIRATDAAVEESFERLRAGGHLRNTIVIMTADHGEEFLDHGGLGHGTKLYQELVRVPLIFWGPDVLGPPATITSPVASIDIMPTLLSLAGVPYEPESIDGRSFHLALAGEGPAAPRPILTELLGFRRAVVSGNAKLIFGDPRYGPEEAYRIAGDGREAEAIDRWPERATLRTIALDTARRADDRGAALGLLPSRVPIDEATREHLEALGYVD